MDLSAGEHRTFTHRVLRWVAILAVAFGLLNVASFAIHFAYQGSRFARGWYDEEIGYVHFGVAVCVTILQIVGGWALLKWKRWGRTLLIIAAVLAIIVGLLLMIGSIQFYMRHIAATSQPVRLELSLLAWNSFHYWMLNCGVPVMMLAVLLQSEVKSLWSEVPASGFDVIPLAVKTGSEFSPNPGSEINP